MAKQVKVDGKKTQPKTNLHTQDLLMTRSPKTNFFFALALGMLYIAIFNRTFQEALVYGIGAFLFFNTVDYLILYHRINKNLKENK